MFGQGSKSSNSRNQFVSQVRNAEFGKHKTSFDTAEKLLGMNKKPEQFLRQTKLSLEPTNRTTTNTKLHDRVAPKAELIFFPIPKKRTTTTIEQNKEIATTSGANLQIEKNVELYKQQATLNDKSSLFKNGRDMICLLGRVDFCLKMRKLHPEVNAMWDVYGKLLKITRGKHRGEHNLLMRNNDSGPLLQSIYFDFDGILKKFHVGGGGGYIRVVGRFIAINRLQAHKVEEISSSVWQHKNFQRIQNVTSFVLLQNQNKNNVASKR